MRILSIGNSFSQDAHRYLHSLAKREKTDLKTVNLMIGGCSLRTHYLNALSDASDYFFEFNGENAGLKVPMSLALSSDDWDVVTLQQVSHLSAKRETYFPYIVELSEYVRKFCPNSRIFIHETWAYEDGSERLKSIGYDSAAAMAEDVCAAYQKAGEAISADGVIPCGKAMLAAAKNGGVKVHRDGFHASLGVGRYILALTWYKALTGRDVSENSFDDFDVPVSREEREVAIQAVNSAFLQAGN